MSFSATVRGTLSEDTLIQVELKAEIEARLIADAEAKGMELSVYAGSVIEHMKPLIREWMDEHFPALLEGAVRAEVERVVKARAVKR